MPMRCARPCRHPGCPQLVRDAIGFCEPHRSQHHAEIDARRPRTARAAYSDSAWRKRRADHLRIEPNCRMRDMSCSGPMRVDHVVARRDGGGDEHSNLRTLCERHHNQRTAKDQGIGGPKNYHAVANTQCLCRSCNQQKGARYETKGSATQKSEDPTNSRCGPFAHVLPKNGGKNVGR